MVLFWIGAVALALFAALLVGWPLLCRPKEDAVSLVALNARVFRERLQELQQDHDAGRIDAESFRQQRTELERNLLSLTEETESPVRSRSLRPLFFVLLTGLPVLAVLFYLFFQFNPALPAWWQAERKMAPVIDTVMAGRVPDGSAADYNLRDFILALQKRLQAEPANAEGWFLLGISYLQLDMPDQAVHAFERAWRLEPSRPDITLAYAQTLIFSNKGELTTQSRALLEDVLEKHPRHEGALLLLGMGAYRSQDYATAVAALEKLQVVRQGEARPESTASQQIARVLDEARTALHESAGKPAVVAAESTLQVTVKLDKSLQAKVKPDDTVFVFVRALNGPPMPLAAVRRPARELPLQLRLGDADSMLPSMKLSHVADVVVGARISRSGQVEAMPGDLEAVAVPVRQDGKPHQVELLIQSERR